MRIMISAILAVLAVPASAQTAEEAQVLPRIIDTLCLDLIEDRNGCETAILLTSETEPDAADLLIYTDRRASAPQDALVVARSVAFSGPWHGQTPRLEDGTGGVLLLHEEQIAYGRTPWMQTLTIVHSDAGLIVGGVSYSTYDRPMGGSFSCEVNFLTGHWAISADRPDTETGETIYDVSNTGQAPSTPPALQDWSWARGLPQACTGPLNAWFDASDG